ncbi:unnamed protein product [Prunus armeniaca]|uniref:Reverse transcriptase zinc-binding domain-containing protein n=1 Tax=Prunus armeniaca TaxID=36596 RepID=A0A6J5WFB6_PRUAR|nr:unnamed protein product [Prunus armeniaca]
MSRIDAGSSSSWGWKGLIQGHRILEAGVRWRVGNGENIQICVDRWMPQPYTFKVQSPHPEMPVWVKDLIDPVTKAWKRDEVIRWFSETEAQLILKMPISRLGCPDKLLWHFTKHGNYTVKSGYELAESLHRNGELNRKGEGECSNQKVQKSFWKGIWSLKDNLRRRRMDVENKCGLCNQEACWTFLKRKYAGYEKSEELLQLLAYGF